MPPNPAPVEKNPHPFLTALGGFVLGILATSAWSIETRLPSVNVDTHPDSQTATINPIASSTAASTTADISVLDQVAGDTVTVESVTVPPMKLWVAVEEVNANELGNILGAALVQGPASRISVPLLRPTVSGKTYAVVLYRDDGSGSFDSNADSVYIDFDTGQRVVALFKTIL